MHVSCCADLIRDRRPFGERRNVAVRAQLVRRVRGEFAEMPGLRLTCAQACRLFALRRDICERVFAALVDDGTLSCDADGRFMLQGLTGQRADG